MLLRKISLASLGLVIGSMLTVMGLVAYFLNRPTLNLIGFFYGLPLLLGGLALRSSELLPVAFNEPSPEILALRQRCATYTQNKIRQDVTRYRYGQNVHLDAALTYLGIGNTDEEFPVLVGLREENQNGAYALVLEFESPDVDLETWQKKQEKIEAFFGPGIRAEIHQPEAEQITVSLLALPKEPISQEA